MIAIMPVFLIGIIAFCVISRIEHHANILKDSEEEK